MNGTVAFTLDGREIVALAHETIWAAARRCGTDIPHLCHRPEPGYRPDGNCRACMVEIKGERVLAASCIRKPAPGMVVDSASARAERSRRLVFELLLADQPARPAAHDSSSAFWRWAERVGVSASRFPAAPLRPRSDRSHPAMSVHLDACIHCGLCVRACREVQVNDVIGMAHRGAHARIVFDQGDAMGLSTCVGCGECVQACPTGALMPASLVDADGRGPVAVERKVDTLCPYCGVGCQMSVGVRDGRVAAVEGRPGRANLNRLCVKGRFGMDYADHPHRLIEPLIRLPDRPKRADETVDPANPFTHFRAASWEEALARAAAGFKRIKDKHGPGALAGFGSAKGSNEEAYLFQKLVRTAFGTNNVDHCTRLCHASSVAGLMEGIGSGAVTAPVAECLNSDVIFVIGACPATNHPVAATFIKNAVKRGAKLVVIDPRGQPLSRLALHSIQHRPGSDVALLNSILHVVLAEGLIDREFVARRTEDFESLARHVAAFPPEATEGLTGIASERVRAIARLYGRARAAMIFWGMGIAQHVHGTDNVRCLIAMALACGQIGRPGAGLHPLRGQNNVQGASDAGLIPMFYPDYQSTADPAARARFERFWGTSLSSERGLTSIEIMDAAGEGRIRGLYIMGENPAMSDPDLAHVRAALAELKHLVVQDIFLTETASFADVVLPASAFTEKTGTFTNTDRRVQLARRALQPPGDARPDLWIVEEMGRRLGLAWSYGHPRAVFDEMRHAMDSISGITWERLEREGGVTYPCVHEADLGQDVIFGDAFPTISGRGRFVPAAVAPPDELPDADYPMVLTTGRLLEHWHTGVMTRRSEVLDALEPDASAHLSPVDLERLGVRPGGRVRVSTRRGTIELSARADRDVPPGVVFIPFCFAEAPANRLTNPALDPIARIPELKYCAARIEPAPG